MSKNKISRRDFLQVSFVAATGAVIAGCTSPTPAATVEPVKPTAVEAVAATATEAPKPLVTATQPPVPPTAVTSKYKESPWATAKVTAGELPPVDQRLPKVPFVRDVPAIGKFGGKINEATYAQGGHFYFDGAILAFPQETNNEGNIIQPHLCDKVENNSDFSEFTFHLREGLKWSDGKPLNADVVLWWWKNEQMNVNLFPEGPYSTWKVGNTYAEFTKLDEWTFKVKFPTSYRPCLNMSAHERMSFGATFGQPIDYMSQYHIDFNPDADKLAKEQGFDNWTQAYNSKLYHLGPFANKPHVGPWVKTISETSREQFDRNPYYAEVDKEGNQLPYVDTISMAVVEDAKLRDAKVLAGEMTQSTAVLFQIDLYKQNAEKADYTIINWASSNTAECMMAFNMNHKDPVKYKIHNDIRFRQAMSYAINRKAINDTIYFGLAKEYQATVNNKASYFDNSWLTNCAEYSPDKANALLDEMGLKWDADKKRRIMSDGKPLQTTLIFFPQYPPEILELVGKDWTAVGNETILQNADRGLVEQTGLAANHDCTAWNADMVEEIAAYMPWSIKWMPNDWMRYAVNWWTYYSTAGKAGDQPPKEWNDQFDRMAAWYQAKSDDEYKKLGNQVWQFFSDQLPCIGTVAYAPRPIVNKNGFTNVPAFRQCGYGTVWAKSYFVQTQFWDDPAKHA